ncbi:MAG: DUF4270 family protein [Flavobacteriales bacterium]
MSTSHSPIAVRPYFAVLLLFSLLASQGCRKPEDGLDHELLNPSDTLGTFRTDTTSIIAWPAEDDSVRTSGSLPADELGSYMDDRFGYVGASTVTQVRLSVNNVGPADPSLVCDSLILTLAYTTDDPVYGDPDPQTIKVFQLNEDLSADSIYKSNREPVIDMNDLVQGSPRIFTPSPTTGPVLDGDTLEPQLRIPLSTDLGNSLLAQWGQATLADNTSFLAFFKGLAIMPDNVGQSPLQGGIWRFNLLSGASKMTIYYHNADSVASTFDFMIGTSSAKYTYVRHDHSAASVPGLPQALSDSTLGQVETYVQALGGIRTELRFPYLDHYPNAQLKALAKAELIVPISGEYHDTYVPPQQIFTFRKGDDGKDSFIPDQSYSNTTSGIYDDVNKEYHFDVTRWVQGVLNGTYPNTGLSLKPYSYLGITFVNRAVLAGPSNPDTPMKLVLTFTTY